MVEAVLHGEGMERVAVLASGRVGRPVAIVVPAAGFATVAPRDDAAGLAAVRRCATMRGRDAAAALPSGVTLAVPVNSGGEPVGIVAMLDGDGPVRPEAGEVLHLAALAAMTGVALDEVREQAAAQLRGGLLEELRDTAIPAEDVLRRAARLGCDLSAGAIAVVTEVRSTRPQQLTALVSDDYPGAVAQLLDGRIYALLPADVRADVHPEGAARGLAERLRKHGPTAISSLYADPGELHRAVEEAELVLEVVSRDERMAETMSEGGAGVYRLLFRVLASHPDEMRSFFEDTVAPVVRYDDRYHTDLLATLEAYLAQECNMNATARAIYAHRHTVAYRLERIQQLTGLDPTASEDRERLSLGLKAYRIVAPSLPR
jgi:sugar diacid utilization regulator